MWRCLRREILSPRGRYQPSLAINHSQSDGRRLSNNILTRDVVFRARLPLFTQRPILVSPNTTPPLGAGTRIAQCQDRLLPRLPLVPLCFVRNPAAASTVPSHAPTIISTDAFPGPSGPGPVFLPWYSSDPDCPVSFGSTPHPAAETIPKVLPKARSASRLVHIFLSPSCIPTVNVKTQWLHRTHAEGGASKQLARLIQHWPDSLLDLVTQSTGRGTYRPLS